MLLDDTNRFIFGTPLTARDMMGVNISIRQFRLLPWLVDCINFKIITHPKDAAEKVVITTGDFVAFSGCKEEDITEELLYVLEKYFGTWATEVFLPDGKPAIALFAPDYDREGLNVEEGGFIPFMSMDTVMQGALAAFVSIREKWDREKSS